MEGKDVKHEEIPQPKINIETVDDPGYREFFVSEAWGGFKKPDVFDVTFCDASQEMNPEAKDTINVKRLRKVRLIMSAETVKSIAEWMMKHYENRGKLAEKEKRPISSTGETSQYIR